MRYSFGPIRRAALVVAFALVAPNALCRADITTTGDVNPDPNTATGSYTLYVGDTSFGTMDVTLGSVLNSGYSYIGNAPGASGIVTVDGAGTRWNTRNLFIGRDGDGELNVTNGGFLDSEQSYIGDHVGATGVVNIDGAGSRWFNDRLTVGWDGAGALNIIGGAAITSFLGVIADRAGSSGDVIIDGANSVWNVPTPLRVGNHGAGTMTLSNGGTFTTLSDVIVAANHQPDSYIEFDGGILNAEKIFANYANLRGAGTINTEGWLFDDTRTIGAPGDLPTAIVLNSEPGQNIDVHLNWTGDGLFGADQNGAVTVTNGQQVLSEEGYVGDSFGSTSSVRVEGAGAMWTNTGDLFVGQDGDGVLTVADGGLVDIGGAVHIAVNNQTNSHIEFDGGTINVGSVLANYANLRGTGTINADSWLIHETMTINGLANLPATLTLNSEPSQNISVNLNWTGDGVFGADQGGDVTFTGGESIHSEVGYVNYTSGSSRLTISCEDTVWEISEDLYVARLGEGTLDINEGASVSNDYGYIAYEPDSTGAVVVDGPNSTWTNQQYLYVGYYGDGTLHISNGGRASSLYSYLGLTDGSSGTVVVTEDGSEWMNENTIFVGNLGEAALVVSASGEIETGSISVGYQSTGVVTVEGVGSTLTAANGGVVVGDFGDGTVHVTDGGVFSIDSLSIGATIGRRNGSTGVTFVDGDGSTWSMFSYLWVGREGAGRLEITNGGVVSNSNGVIGDDLGGTGVVTVNGDGSTWTNTGDVFIGVDGEGTLRIQNGGLVTVGGDLSQNAVSTLQLTLASTSDAFLDVTGGATLDGLIDIELADGYIPNGGDVFQLLSASSYSGAPTFDFAGAILPNGLSWDTTQFLIDGTLAVAGVLLTADFDDDGDVDGDDFLSWQASFGVNDGGDADADGDTDGDDFLIWQSQFGNGGAGAIAVPEPSAGLLAVIVALCCRVVKIRRTRMV